jgi:F0F1-type ATP synthase assembly protein I
MPGLKRRKRNAYTPSGARTDRRDKWRQSDGSRPSGESLAYFIVAGIAVGFGLGYGLDRLVGTFPILAALGMFAGLVFAVYVVYLRMR